MALQNLAFDSSMHEFVRGTHVPYWLSLILCYVTLVQRLIVPFGFFFMQVIRFLSVLVLGAMHIGYAILMYVNLFRSLAYCFLADDSAAPDIVPCPGRSSRNPVAK